MSCHRSVAAAAAGLCFLAAVPFSLLHVSLLHAQTPLTLAVTVSTDLTPGSCGDSQTLEITAGDAVNFCYTITNASSDDLAFHTLRDDVNGVLLLDHAQDVPAGGRFQYNDVRVVSASQAPNSTWTAATALADYTSAPNDPDRLFSDGFDGGVAPPVYAFEDISATGTDLTLGDDGEATVPIGFDFTFYGATSNQVRVGNNGAMLFGVDSGEVGYNNLPLPNATLGPAILPFWDDFAAGGDGGVYAQTLGETPNRRLVVQWNRRLHYVSPGAASDPATFEAILYEGSNAIVFQYADVDMDGSEFDGGLSATIGLNQGARASQYAYDVAAVTAGTAIRFLPTPVTSYSASAGVALTAGSPNIVVDPVAVSVVVAAGASAQAPLTIGNVGDAALVWTLAEANAPSVRLPTWLSSSPAQAGSTRSYAPRSLAPALLPANKAGAAVAGSVVPAFGVNLNAVAGNTLVRFDAANPGATTPVGAIERTLVGGAFLDGDVGALYALDFDSGELVRVSTTDASVSVIGTAAALNGEDWSGLARDPVSGTLYASSTRMVDELSSTLYAIDPATGAATPIGPISGGGRVIEIAADVGGQLYGVDIAADRLVAIDKSSGAGQPIGPLGFNAEFAEGLDFDPSTNLLYFAAVDNQSAFSQPGQMYTIDTATGHATLVGGISADPATAQIAAFAIALPPSPCSTPADVPWLTLSTTAGTTAAGATTPVEIGVDATALAAGDYGATLCVRSNDADRHLVTVPVALSVH